MIDFGEILNVHHAIDTGCRDADHILRCVIALADHPDAIDRQTVGEYITHQLAVREELADDGIYYP